MSNKIHKIYDTIIDGAQSGLTGEKLSRYVIENSPKATSKKIVKASLLALSDDKMRDRNILGVIAALAIKHRCEPLSKDEVKKINTGTPEVKIRAVEEPPAESAVSKPADQAAEITSILVPLARDGTTITYGELAKRLRTARYNPRELPFHQLLCDVSEAEEKKGKGLLSAVVVTAQTGRPGMGFFSFAERMGRDTKDRERFWQEEALSLRKSYSSHLSAASE